MRTSKNELHLAYGLTVCLLVIGVVCFTAYSAKIPEEPVRIMFKCPAGKVLYDHKTHASVPGHGQACKECHHPHPEGEEPEMIACGECHNLTPKGEIASKKCWDCHDEGEDLKIINRAEAFHKQCKDCHKKWERGPLKCSECHVI
jgi:hypothetical protein